MNLPPLPLVDGCFFIDNSSLEALQTCPRSFQYSRLAKRISSADKPALSFGSALHLALEWRYKNCKNSSPTIVDEDEIGQVLNTYFTEHPVGEEEHRNLNLAIEIMRRYNLKYHLEPFNILVDDKGQAMVELSFALPLYVSQEVGVGDNHLKDIPVIYTGRIDLPVSWDDQLIIIDHKTTSMLGEQFFEEQKMSAQQLGYCFSPDTELLTQDGWIRIDRIQEWHKVTQWDKGIMTLVAPKEYFSKDINENLVMYTNGIETLTTEEHRFICRDRQSDKYKEFTAKTLPLSPNYRVPTGGLLVNNFTVHQDAFLQFAAMLQADGSITSAQAIKFHFSKNRKIERCRNFFLKNSVKFTESVHSDGTTVFYLSCDEPLVRTTIALLTPAKEFGPWLLLCNASQLSLFLEEVSHWDGSDRGQRGFIYSSSSKNNAEWIQTIAALVNRRATIHTQKLNDKVQWRVNVSFNTEIGTGGLNKIAVPYKGTVYCVNVPSSYLLTRRNQVISVVGNCWAFEALTGQHVNGFCINGIRTRIPPAKPKEGIENWWDASLQRDITYLRPGQLEEWKSNTIALIETFFWHYQRDYLPMATKWCVGKYGKCPYFDVCSLKSENRELLLSSPVYMDNTWSPLK